MRTVAALLKRKAFKPSLIGQVLREAFARWGRRYEQRRAPHILAAPARRRGFMLEQLEPRLLLSADLSYTGPIANPTATEFWLKAISSNQVQLYDSATDTGSSHEATLSAFTITAGTVTMDRLLGGDALSDTVHLVTDSFAQLDPGSTGITGNGNKLGISFEGGDQTLFQDVVMLDDSTATDLTQTNHAFGLSVTSNSQITASNTSINVAGDLSLMSDQTGSDKITGLVVGGKGALALGNAGVTLDGATLQATGGTLTLEAHSNLGVTNVTADGSNTGDAGATG